MASSVINSDDGVVSGTSGLKTSGGDDGILKIQTNGTDAVTVDSSGNVGIGTTSPSVRTEVSDLSASAYSPATNVDANGLPSGTNLLIRNSSSSSNTFAGIGFLSRNSRLNYIGTAAGNDPNTPVLVFGARTSNTASQEFMRITSAGRVAIGVTGPTFLLELPNNAADATGRGRANQWATYSDGRIKTDRESLPYGIDAVMQLEPLKYFHHNSKTNEDGNVEILEEGAESIGLVAQDVAAIIPEIVSVPEDLNKDLCSLDYSKLTTVLVKAVQDLKAELDTVKAELETLKGN
jgi:hypothetical protein